MNFKYIALIVGAALALGYGVGRYLQPAEIKTVVQVKKEIEVQEKVRTITKIVEHKNGDKETIIDEDKEKNTQSDTTKSKDTIVELSKPRSNFSLMAGISPKLFGGLSPGAVSLGASYDVQPVSFIPVTLGLWGLAIPDATIGFRLGWNY
jgi:hypothetical protein